jgi:phosphohistidine phosphatase
MLTIYLMRHAKSDWQSNASTDFERPLNPRGCKDAVRMGQWFKAQDLQPQILLASSARRSQQTVLAVAKILGVKEDRVAFNDNLYLADRSRLINALSEVPANTEAVLLVAHNPGLDELVKWLSSEPPVLTESGKLMTTAAIAVFELADGLAGLERGRASLRQLIRPGELRILIKGSST